MYQRTLTDHFHTWCQYLNNFVISYSYYIHIYVVASHANVLRGSSRVPTPRGEE